jgi:hypothetical protein
MKVIFVGSLDAHSADLELIKNNFMSLVKHLAENDVGFVVRSVIQENDARIPIDCLVLAALEEHCNIGGKLSKHSLVVFKEPGVTTTRKVTLPHITHSASTAYRIEFYKELLDLVDIVVGVGGEFGLLRLSMLCEWLKKPIYLLPGAGGTTDFLWQDFFKKSYQTIVFNDKERIRLKQSPMINENNPSYPSIIYDLILLVNKTVEARMTKSSDIITPDNVTAPIFFTSLKKFSIGLWLLVISIVISLCSIAYYAGESGLFKQHIGKKEVYDKTNNQQKP